MISYGFQTDTGRVRGHNEDAVGAAPDLGLFLVADGMGGHAAGEVASRMAVDATVRAVRECAGNGQLGTPDGIRDVLLDAVRKANADVFSESVANHRARGMGTTLTAILLADDRYHIAHVGDSRGYRVRGGEIVRITRDHSYVEELVRKGMLSSADARTHPQRNIVTRSVGTQEGLEADYRTGEVRAGDVYLLCSDGVSGELEDGEILEIVEAERADLQNTCDELVRRANEAGGRDNSSVVLVRVDG